MHDGRGAVANIRIQFLVKKRKSWFWQPSATLARAGWESVPLGHDEGKAIEEARAINKRVEEWRLGGPGPGQVKAHVARGTGADLIERYRRLYLNARHQDGPRAGQYKLAVRTRENYETPLKRLEMWMGQSLLETITPKRVKVLKETLIGPEAKGGIGHAPAFQTLKMGRQLFAFAISEDLFTARNPFLNFGLGAVPARRTIWKAQHEKAFDDAALRLGLPSLALARKLALYSAQREGDLLRFTENDFAPIELFDPKLIEHFGDRDGVVKGWILEQQHKTDMPLQIPFDPAIRAEVEKALRSNRARDRAATPPRLVTHVITEERTGVPWKQRHFITQWRRVLADAARATGMAEMNELVWHDHRRTRVVRLRRMGMAKEQIATVTGTSNQTIDAMLDAYGPIDATMTAHALAAAATHELAQQAAIEEKKGKQG
jgi:hypothetical protein